jgi:hypothetical protein
MKTNHRSTVGKGLNLSTKMHKPKLGKGAYDRKAFKNFSKET